MKFGGVFGIGIVFYNKGIAVKLLKVIFRALAFLFVFYPFCVMAVVIEFPKEELARESVLPVFDNPVAVKSRLVPTKGRVELGVASGFALNEPFFKTLRYGGHLAYHITETHGFLLEGQIYQQGLNRNGNALNEKNFGENKSEKEHLRIKYAPQPESHFMANYQITGLLWEDFCVKRHGDESVFGMV